MDTLVFESSATFTLASWSVDGAPGVYIAIEASTPGVAHTLVNATAGVFTSTYCIITDSHAEDAALWTADTGCEDWGDNAGWWEDASPVVGDRVFFGPGESYDITGWSVDGAPGAAILVTSNPPTATHYLVRASGGPFSSDWCVISHSDASADSDWSAGSNSFDAGDNRAGGWFSSALTALGAFSLSGPGISAMALVASPGVGAFSALAPAVSGVLVQGARGVVFVPLAAPGAAGVSGEGSGGVGAADASAGVAGIAGEALAAALSALVDGPAADGLAGEGSTAGGAFEALAPTITAALVEACRIVGEIETAELHWHGYSRRGRPYLPILTRIAEWPSPEEVVLRWAAPQTFVAAWSGPQTLTRRWAEPQIYTITWEGGPWPD